MSRARHSALRAACVLLLAHAPARALELEIGAQMLATLVSDHDTKGGGVGLGVEGGWVLGRPALAPSAVLAQARVSLLGGAGLAWGLEAGCAWRAELHPVWQPQAGAHLLYAGGDLARSVDGRGQLASNPVAIVLGISLGRLALDHGWVSFLAVRGGPTLGRSGHPPLALSLTVFEVGQRF
jgi:hypothetical protein